MESGGSISHSQGLSNNPYPKPNQPSSTHEYLISLRYTLILFSHLRLGVGFFPVKLFKTLLHPSLLTTGSAHLNLLDLIALTI